MYDGCECGRQSAPARLVVIRYVQTKEIYRPLIEEVRLAVRV
jgi:hypothetical protein